MPISNININWSNKNSELFYNHLSLLDFEMFLERSGLNQNDDLRLIEKFVLNSKSLLEIGAGFGRVIIYFIDHGFTGEISVIEKNNNFYKTLISSLPNFVHVHHIDVFNFISDKKYDSILWLWCGISDFSKLEQEILIKKFLSFLSENGMLFIDSIKVTKKNQNQSLIFKNNIIHRYFPTTLEIYKIAKSMKFTLKVLSYKTYFNSNIINRRIYLLYK